MIRVLVRDFYSTRLATAACILVVAGCAQTPSTLRIEAWNVNLDVALTQKAREIGLSGRRELESDGLLMATPDEGPKALWMRNTFVPLTAIALDEAGCIVAVKELMPLDERIIYLPDSTRWIVELIEPVKNDLYAQQNCLDAGSLPLPVD